jgi:hypothetical protein
VTLSLSEVMRLERIGNVSAYLEDAQSAISKADVHLKELERLTRLPDGTSGGVSDYPTPVPLSPGDSTAT